MPAVQRTNRSGTPYYGYIRQQEMSTKSPHEIFNERFDDDHHLRVSGQNCCVYLDDVATKNLRKE